MNRLGFRPEEFADGACAAAPHSAVSRGTGAGHAPGERRRSAQRSDDGCRSRRGFDAVDGRLPGRAQHRQFRGCARLARARVPDGSARASCCTASRRSRTRPAPDFGLRAGDDARDRGDRGQERRGRARRSVTAAPGVRARATRIAVVAAGYGDGYPRATRPARRCMVNGRRAPLVGRVSMDMITVDVTDLPAVRSAIRWMLWGADVPVEEIARHAGTIPYELICGVSQRVQIEVAVTTWPFHLRCDGGPLRQPRLSSRRSPS